jgi:hypothetical protein
MSRRDVETDLRHQLSRDAVIGEAQLRRSAMTTVDSVLDYLVSRAYGDPERLLDAMDLLGQQDADARALLTRAARRAADPLGPAAPPPSVAFLPPFDPLVWDRPLLGSLFGFDYVWELFLPPAKRRWAGTCCRSYSATASSAGSSRESTAIATAWRCSDSGGTTASRPGAPQGS